MNGNICKYGVHAVIHDAEQTDLSLNHLPLQLLSHATCMHPYTPNHSTWVIRPAVHATTVTVTETCTNLGMTIHTTWQHYILPHATCTTADT